MRIWSLHPRYLDSQGLVALWREGLLAQKVLAGQTKGYRNHPQLIRFKEQADPMASIAVYLKEVYQEACRRSFHFDPDKIPVVKKRLSKIKLTQGQLDFETEHLYQKLQSRTPEQYKILRQVSKIEPHPLFKIISGKVAVWEKGIENAHNA
ncbi:MAG: hypothetical protein H6754_07205 [Candidatus Omnitrophica bacterium]|nr:hypothetical protein [Candidatus Omnitrophota bacterium]